MENFLINFLIAVLGSSIVLSIAIAGVLAYNDMQGWGWFLFIAFMLASSIKVSG